MSNIRRKPSHLTATISHARPSHSEGGLGNIRHDHTAVALIQESVDKKRRSSSDVDDRAVLRRRNCADQFRSSRRFRFKPADLVSRLARPYLPPVQLRIMHRHSLLVTFSRHLLNDYSAELDTPTRERRSQSRGSSPADRPRLRTQECPTQFREHGREISCFLGPDFTNSGLLLCRTASSKSSEFCSLNTVASVRRPAPSRW